MFIDLHAHRCAHRRARTQTCTHTYTRTHTDVHTHTHMHAHTHSVRAHTHTHTHACTHTHRCAHARTHTHKDTVHTHTCTYARMHTNTQPILLKPLSQHGAPPLRLMIPGPATICNLHSPVPAINIYETLQELISIKYLKCVTGKYYPSAEAITIWMRLPHSSECSQSRSTCCSIWNQYEWLINTASLVMNTHWP
jgi:hypothetical protein